MMKKSSEDGLELASEARGALSEKEYLQPTESHQENRGKE